MTDDQPTLIDKCPDCQGYGAIQLPGTTISTAFGRIYYPAKVVGCPSCAGSGLTA